MICEAFQSKKSLVITLHGIRTFAPWQKDLADELGKAGFKTKSLHYGYFSSLKLILPSSRRKQIEWFRDRYTEITNEYPDVVPSVIAHSFGTYIITRALELFDGVKFDQVILCGSVVPRDYEWQPLFTGGQVNRILNECAKRDLVVRAAPFFVQDAGASGVWGFSEKNSAMLCQRFISKFGHSDYLHVLNFRQNWIPFLLGGVAPKDRPPLNNEFNWKFFVTVFLLLVLLAGGIIGVSKIAGSLITELSSEKRTQVITQPPPQMTLSSTYLRGNIEDSQGNRIAGALIRIDEFPDLLAYSTSNGDFYVGNIPVEDGTRVLVQVSATGYKEKREFVVLPGPKGFILIKGR